MSKVMAEFSLSLDGFVAGADDDVGPVMGWYRQGDTELAVPGAPYPFRVARATADLLREAWGSLGAIVTGRRDFDVSKAWGGQPAMGLPTFIVTHHPPAEWAGPGSPFTFVTDGVASALRQARAAAGGKNVGLSGTQVVQQALRAGLVDELQIDLVPVLLGAGIRLFGDTGPGPITLEQLEVIPGTGVTHLRYRVVAEAP